MEQTLESLLSTLAVDVLIFLICLIISSIIRKSRNTTKSLILPEEFNQRPYLNESESSFWVLIKRVYSFTSTDLIKTLSFKSYIFMELHRDIIYGLLAMTLFGFTALIPVYSQGNAETEYELDKYSITNALESENLMIAPVCMIFIYSTIIYSVVTIYQKRCRQEEADVSYIQANNLSLYSICVYGLPKQQSAQKLQGEFSEYVSKAFGENRVSFAYIVGNYTEAYVLDMKIKKLKAKLWHAEKYFEM
jgi:hypothetical protein